MPQYYNPQNGVWLESCADNTPCSFQGAALAPADMNGFHGAEGLRWDGTAWIDEPDAAALVAAFLDPVAAIAEERKAMICTPRQGFLVMTDAEFTAYQLVLNQLPPRQRAAAEAAQVWERLSPDFLPLAIAAGFTDERMDELFRLAMTR